VQGLRLGVRSSLCLTLLLLLGGCGSQGATTTVIIHDGGSTTAAASAPTNPQCSQFTENFAREAAGVAYWLGDPHNNLYEAYSKIAQFRAMAAQDASDAVEMGCMTRAEASQRLDDISKGF
jgi:hypothetical protein